MLNYFVINKKMAEQKKFISYKDDDDNIVKGYFEIVEKNENYLKFKSGKNQITIPWNRVIKFKEELKGGKI